MDKSRRNRRPEREIYRPGPVRHRAGSRTSEGPNDEHVISDPPHLQEQNLPPDSYPAGNHKTSTDLKAHHQGVKEIQSDLQHMQLSAEQTDACGAEHSAEQDSQTGDKFSKKRSKRPDLQIYVPKLKTRQSSISESLDDADTTENVDKKYTDNSGSRGGSKGDVSHTNVHPTNKAVSMETDPLGSPSTPPSKSFRNRCDSPSQAGLSKRLEQDHRGGRHGAREQGGHHGQPHRSHNGPVHSHEAEDAMRYNRPPRGGRQQRRGSAGGRGSEHKPLRKANSLEWDDGKDYVEDGRHLERLHQVHHGWGTDITDDAQQEEDIENNKPRKKKRERRPSGQRGRDNRRGSLSKTQDNRKEASSPAIPKGDQVKGKDQSNKSRTDQRQQQPQQQPQPKVTADEKVEKSISKGTFQGMVFTNSKLDKNSDKGNQNSEREDKENSERSNNTKNPEHRKRQERNNNRHRATDSKEKGNGGKDEVKQKVESEVPPTGNPLTWDEQVEEAERLQEEEHERQRISAVIQERERNMGKKDPSKGRNSNRNNVTDHEDHGRRPDKQGKSWDRNQAKDSKHQGKQEDSSKKGLSLKVTFAGASDERKVLLGGSDSAERDIGGRASPRISNHSESRHGRGGLIKLPASMPNMNVGESGPQHNHHHHAPPRHLQSHPHPHHNPGGPHANKGHHQTPNRGRVHSRGGSHRTLYDPNNPSKSTHSSTSPKGLHFCDPTEPHQDPPPHHQRPIFPDQFPRKMLPSGEYSGSPKNYYEYGFPQGGPRFYNMPLTRMPPPPPHMMQHQQQHMFDRRMPPEDFNKEQYYQSYDQENSSRVSPANKSKAEGIVKEMVTQDNQLCSLVSRGVCHHDVLLKMQLLRSGLQELFEKAILLDPELCNNQNVDQMLWKTAYYQVIEMLKKQLAEQHNDKLKDLLLKILEEGTTFYENLLKSLQQTYNFNLESFIDSNTPAPSNLCRTTKLALYSAQKTMIFLGDIARYKEQVHQTANYGKARHWYLKAQQIAPKNGRPYNQLAILALYTRRKLDAVYYYMRSLAASNPFITARESLMSLFDEARKRAEVSEKKRLQEITQRKKLQQQQRRKVANRSNSDDYSHRVEIWISSDGSTCHDEIKAGDDEWDDLMKISAVELNKRFVLSFLNVHGKLFTKIGMETFPEVSSQMLHEFRALLSHSPSPIGNSRLLQLVTINMFAIENAAPKDTSQMEENCRSLHQEQAVQLGLDMFGLLADRCTTLLLEHINSRDFQILSEDLHCLFPSVKVWADWMTLHNDLWNPPPLSRDPELGPTIDVWKSVASLCNMLMYVEISHVKIYSQKKEGCDPIVLPEDASLAGFVPLLSLPQNDFFVHSTFDKDIARDCLRVDKLRTFADYLYGIEPPLLSYNAETREYVSIAPETNGSDLSNPGAEGEDDVIIESESEGEGAELNMSFGSSGDEGQIKHLRARKEELERKMAEQERQQQNIRAVLDDTEQLNRRTELEIRPLFLVPDTNCFIDHLKGVQQLLNTKKYTIVVPLVVINELDGLAKGSKDGQYDTMEHAEMVYTGAQKAIVYLEETFESRNSHMRALTSKGSVLDTISFRVEETQDEGNNDDLILSCCLHYCQDKARDFMPKNKDEPIRLHREVVLLTDDRNLRLKAHTRNVPVKDIPTFMKWAKIG